MKFLANYIITFILFGAFLYLLLPRLMKRPLTKDVRIQKSIWAALLFTVVKMVLDVLVP